jgi:hypothetical protein
MNDHLAAIVRIAATDKIDPDASLEDRFRAAFAGVQHHWMVTDPEVQYRAAIEAVYLGANPDEQARILTELQVIKTLNAMLSGVSVDLDNIPKCENPIRLTKLWNEACETA